VVGERGQSVSHTMQGCDVFVHGFYSAKVQSEITRKQSEVLSCTVDLMLESCGTAWCDSLPWMMFA